MCTIVRFSVETAIKHLKSRYQIAKFIPWWVCHASGYMYNFCAAIHNMFKIGMFSTSQKRSIILHFTEMNLNKWTAKHPISRSLFKKATMNAVKKRNSDFIEVQTSEQITQQWSVDLIQKWLFKPSELVVKGGGVHAISKAYLQLYKSRHYVKLFIGKKHTPWEGTIVVTNLIRAMGPIYKGMDISGQVTKVFLTYTRDGLQNDPTCPHWYDKNLTHTLGTCNNRYGMRTTNFCSHQIAALLLFKTKFKNEQIPLPTPAVDKRFQHLTDIAKWVHGVSGMDLEQRKMYFDNILENEAYLTSDFIYLVKNMYLD